MKKNIPLRLIKHSTLQKAKNSLHEKDELIKTAITFINSVENGNFDFSILESFSNQKHDLTDSLSKMGKKINDINEQEKKRNWAIEGLAKFGEILRQNNDDLSSLSDSIIKNLVKYTNANQGGLFILNNEPEGDQYLELTACYAYNRKKHLDKKIALGQGLNGQVFLEKKTTYLTRIPKNYINITSGLGDAPPRAILIVPLKINDTVYGTVELASFNLFEPHHIEFVEKLGESIASTISSLKVTLQTKKLLQENQQKASMVQAQEEELRQNFEEMQATQEALSRKNIELENFSAESRCILGAIDSTMATIEFTPTGEIVSANENFLKTMKYSLSEIKGKHHRIFVSKDVLESGLYEKFWKRLASGNPFNGIYKRLNSKGEVVWLNAIYNPILDADGSVIKVIKFANNITEQQNLIAERKGILEGIDHAMATIEFTTNGEILKANEKFLQSTGYELDEIVGKHHRIFVPKEIRESASYQTFWEKLASGESFSGSFKRINAKGEDIWLNAIYNPVKDAEGNIKKVAKFATIVSNKKEETENENLVSN
ncbi:PAS domain-containing protein [Flammeovirgaceae bacterium SG7u.111]|nr:PAS domain-containing protein [Flammeovirgaceae bacterium SG7u.132]WPO37678.1 PAS domain-containing protein [Flammeovirgaceae bacterium SG7u.111]